MKYRIEHKGSGKIAFGDVWKRGSALLSDALLNKGTAFSIEERTIFDLEGMLPHQPTDRVTQMRRAYENIQAMGDQPLEEYVRLVALQDRNETLFYQVLAEHLEELLPIVYTPTVGAAAVRFSHVFRRGRGLWITPAHRGRIGEILSHVRNEEVRLIVVTDNERILGLGDQGAGGMVIPIGKLALYTLGAGIHPAVTLPISLDVGTDNEALLEDDLYVGWRQPRLRGDAYYSLVDEFVAAVQLRFPGALLQWEDFKKANAFALLDKYRQVVPSFNDDIQGTAAVVAAGVVAASRTTNTPLAEQRFLLAGAGAAGVGIARHLQADLETAGLTEAECTRAIALVDSEGLVTTSRSNLEAHKEPFAWPTELTRKHGLEAADDALADVVAALRPTVLIGTTGQPGLFSDDVLRAMAQGAARPLIMALSNPTAKTEAVPSDIVAQTEGRALVAAGSPFEPVEYEGRTVAVSQCNNVYIFPGVGLGALVAQASAVTDSMFSAASRALAAQVDSARLDAGYLYPPLSDLRAITRHIAAAVAGAARNSGVGRSITDSEIDAELDRQMWDLEYPVLIPA